MRGRLKREGIYLYLQLIHIAVQQKLTQHCKAIILQLKINLKINKKLKNTGTHVNTDVPQIQETKFG